MGICLIFTLGNRDIQLDVNNVDELIEEIISNEEDLKNIWVDRKPKFNKYKIIPQNYKFYETTRKIFEEISKNPEKFEKLKKHLKLPMIKPVIEEYMEKRKEKIDKVILIASNQKHLNEDEENRQKDTFYEAKIIKKYLEDKYKFNIEIWELNKDISKIMEVFKEIKDKYLLKENLNYEKIIFEVSGGTPQMREALRLLFLLKKNVIFHEVKDERPDSGDNMNFYNFQILLEKIKSLIENYNYTGALAFEEYLPNDVAKALEYLNYRLNFDFKHAEEIAEKNKLVKEFNDRLEKIINEKNTVKKLECLILELLDNMEIELRRGEYTNFLARVYRLEEAMGQYLLLKWFKRANTKISYKMPGSSPSGLIDVSELGDENINMKIKSFFIYLSSQLKNGKEFKHEGVRKLIKFIKSNYKYGAKKNKYIIENFDTSTYYALVRYLYGDDSQECKLYENIQKNLQKGR